MNKAKLFYFFIRAITLPLSFLPYKAIHYLGKYVGLLCFYCIPSYRKKTLSNLSLAKDLNLSKKQVISIAKSSFGNLAINILEYPRLAKEKDFSKYAQCLNPENATKIYQEGTGIIFFCGHQANWEALFLDGNTRMKGIAIGKPIKNIFLYNWILSIREKTGGKIVIPQKAMKEAVRALKKGEFVGIVGDQGMPTSNYSFPFFGRRAWNSTAPALLSYKVKAPIIVATTERKKGKYFISYSDPIWPNYDQPLEKEVPCMMDKCLKILESSIKANPGQWLWQHNRWKQHTPREIKKEFRHDSICIIMPEREEDFIEISESLSTLKAIYPTVFSLIYIPQKYKDKESSITTDEKKVYSSLEDMLIEDYRPKLVFDFIGNKKIEKHFKKLCAFEVLTKDRIYRLANKNHSPESAPANLSQAFLWALCRTPLALTKIAEERSGYASF